MFTSPVLHSRIDLSSILATAVESNESESSTLLLLLLLSYAKSTASRTEGVSLTEFQRGREDPETRPKLLKLFGETLTVV